ncbi:hypothetical protein DFH09DRAFT_1391600 [Mycena vulgaris]|nr:hypothetical protein DFH09DRAFT_1391600 [Mycena vulgaris]
MSLPMPSASRKILPRHSPRRMDVLFGNDCRDDLGHFRYIARGKYGMDLVVQYFRSIGWKSAGISFNIAAVKMTSIGKDSEVLCAVGDSPNGPPLTAGITCTSSAPSTSKRPATDVASDAEEVPAKKGKRNIMGSSRRVVKDDSRRRAKKTQVSRTSDPTTVGADEMLADIDVQPIAETSATTKLDPAADVNHFFLKPFIAKGVRGSDKLHRNCKICGDRTIKDLSTNRRHLGKYHADVYRKWAKEHDFESRLEADVKARRSHFWAALEAALNKVNEYYEKTADSDAYLLAMALNPDKRLAHITKNWSEELQEQALANLEKSGECDKSAMNFPI